MRRAGARLAALLIALGPLIAPTASRGAVTQSHGIRLAFSGSLRPRALPRSGSAPVSVSLSARIAPADAGSLPQLRRIAIAINRYGRLDPRGLPRCRIDRIQPATSAEALASCRGALVGRGTFSADVRVSEQAPFPSLGQVLAFNGRFHGRPAILAHIYGVDPAPTSDVLAFVVRHGRGSFGTVLEAKLPPITGSWGYVTGISLHLGRTFRRHGRRRSYLSAGCPAPPGISIAPFTLARTALAFAGGASLDSTLSKTCRVAG